MNCYICGSQSFEFMRTCTGGTASIVTHNGEGHADNASVSRSVADLKLSFRNFSRTCLALWIVFRPSDVGVTSFAIYSLLGI